MGARAHSVSIVEKQGIISITRKSQDTNRRVTSTTEVKSPPIKSPDLPRWQLNYEFITDTAQEAIHLKATILDMFFTPPDFVPPPGRLTPIYKYTHMHELDHHLEVYDINIREMRDLMTVLMSGQCVRRLWRRSPARGMTIELWRRVQLML